MRVLIATNELQSAAQGDFSFTVEGELVTPVAVACDETERCGCDRGFRGLASGRATTTAMVVSRPFITACDLRDAVRHGPVRDGWAALLTGSSCDDDDVESALEEIVDEHVDLIAEVCHSFRVGTVVQRSGAVLTARSHHDAA